MERRRPKLEIPRDEKLNLRFSKFEKEKIARVAKQKNLKICPEIIKKFLPALLMVMS